MAYAHPAPFLLGADWIGSLNYYGLGDPLTLLKEKNDE